MQRATYRHNLTRNMGLRADVVCPYTSKFWAGRGLIRKMKVQCSPLCSWFKEIVLICNNTSVQSREKIDKMHSQIPCICRSLNEFSDSNDEQSGLH